MLDDAKNLPNDPTALKGLVSSLASELKSRDILIEKLKHQLAGMRQHRFGSRSEALDQLTLTLEDEEIAASAQEPRQTMQMQINPQRQKASQSVSPCPVISRAMRQHCRQVIPVGNAAVR